MAQQSTTRFIVRCLHSFSFGMLIVMNVVTIGYALLCAAQITPWLTLPLTFGDVIVTNAGTLVQLAFTMIMASLLFFIPTSKRVMDLEKSHRKFEVNMDDVARAYHVCHTADRAGVFTLSSEFDAVRERLHYLRDHPDLRTMEIDVLTMAAQMGEKARELADVYGDEKVKRAKEFLRQRQEEAERQQEQIVDAMHICRELRQWADQVEAEETAVASQLEKLDGELQSVLPHLGYGFEPPEPDHKIVHMPMKPAAE